MLLTMINTGDADVGSDHRTSEKAKTHSLVGLMLMSVTVYSLVNVWRAQDL